MKEQMMMAMESMEALIPEEEKLDLQTVDFDNATVRLCDQNLQSLIPDDELAVRTGCGEQNENTEFSEEFFKATDGMAYIENVLDNRLIASIYVDAKGQRSFEVCQSYSDGTVSGKMRIRQADLYRLAMAHFDVEQIPSSPEKQRTRKFLSQFGEDGERRDYSADRNSACGLCRAGEAAHSPGGTGDASATSVQTHYGNF